MFFKDQVKYVNCGTFLTHIYSQGGRHRNSADSDNSQAEHKKTAEPAARTLNCNGRPCATCGNCRDWYYTGDAASWEWIRSLNYYSWKGPIDDAWRRYNNGKYYEGFKRRDGATCTCRAAFGGKYFGPPCGPAPGYPNRPHMGSYTGSCGSGSGSGSDSCSHCSGNGYCCGGCDRCLLCTFDHCFYDDQDYWNGFNGCTSLCLCKDNTKN